MIRPYDELGRPLVPGDIVLFQSALKTGLCSHPKEVVHISRSMMVVRDTRDGQTHSKHQKNLLYVCDTVEEGWHMAKGSMAFVDAEAKIQKELDAQFAKRKRNVLEVLTARFG